MLWWLDLLSIAAKFSREAGSEIVLANVGVSILFAAESLNKRLFDSFSKLPAVSKKLKLVIRNGLVGYFSLFVRKGNPEKFELLLETYLVFNVQILVQFG